VKTIAAYRERRNISDDPQPLGSKATMRSIEALKQRRLVQAAFNTAMRLTHATRTQRPEVISVGVGLTANRGPELW
jgi:hypothetical protein